MAALTEPMAVGLHGVNMARLEGNESILVIGCSDPSPTDDSPDAGLPAPDAGAETMAKPKKKSADSNTIAVNRKARFDYFIEETLEAGVVLQGWEVKSLRAGKAQLSEAFVQLHNGEAWLFNAHITPLLTASTHIRPEPTRRRKLLLHRRQIVGAVERKGYTIVPLDLHWKAGKAKLTIGYARGKKMHDKRATMKDRDWQRQKSRILKHG